MAAGRLPRRPICSLPPASTFEAALLAFPGPVLAVSHDRYFIRRRSGDVWELQGGALRVLPAADSLASAGDTVP